MLVQKDLKGQKVKEAILDEEIEDEMEDRENMVKKTIKVKIDIKGSKQLDIFGNIVPDKIEKDIWLKKCEWCGKTEDEREIYTTTYYDSPFDDEGVELTICEYCEEDNGYVYCSECGRMIAETNGYRKNVRVIEGECMCVACLQKFWFKNGMERFEDGDWFDDDELEENAFIKYNSYFARTNEQYDKGRKDFNGLKKKNSLVIVSIERSGMGFEHYFSIWYKPKINKEGYCKNCGLLEKAEIHDYGCCKKHNTIVKLNEICCKVKRRIKQEKTFEVADIKRNLKYVSELLKEN